MQRGSRSASLVIVVVVAILVGLACQGAYAVENLNVMTLRCDSDFSPGVDYDSGTGKYTFYYSIWGTADWVGKSTISYVDLGVVSWGSYTDFKSYSPDWTTQTRFGPGLFQWTNTQNAPYPKFPAPDTTSDYWYALNGGASGTGYPYQWKPANGVADGTDAAWGGSQVSLKKLVTPVNAQYTNNDLDGDGVSDEYQGATLQGGEIFLGGFSFTATHVGTGSVPWAIWSTDGQRIYGSSNTVGQGMVLGPTPEASTLILLGATVLPFAGYRFRRRKGAQKG